jgi:Cytochrome b involved in lipid metabolism
MSKKAPETERFTPEQVKDHASANDLFVIVHGRVYELTGFLEEHP